MHEVFPGSSARYAVLNECDAGIFRRNLTHDLTRCIRAPVIVHQHANCFVRLKEQ